MHPCCDLLTYQWLFVPTSKFVTNHASTISSDAISRAHCGKLFSDFLVNIEQIKVAPNWLKWQENASKIIFYFVAKKIVNIEEKNQSYSKLAEMATILVRKHFLIFFNPPQIGDEQTLDNKSNVFQIGQNG